MSGRGWGALLFAFELEFRELLIRLAGLCEGEDAARHNFSYI